MDLESQASSLSPSSIKVLLCLNKPVWRLEAGSLLAAARWLWSQVMKTHRECRRPICHHVKGAPDNRV